jgi:hypothetical protein
MAEPTTETQPEHTHVRASKVATYFGTSGALSWGLTAIAIVLHAPLSLPGLILIGGGIGMAATEGGRNFARKLGDQLVDLGNDFMSHLSEDVGRLGKWWHRVTAPKPNAQQPVAQAPAAPEASAFKPAASAPDFNNVAKPGITDDAKPKVLAPAPAAPKPPAP